MQRRTRFWVIIGLLFVVLAACVWRFGFDRARNHPFSSETAAIAAPGDEPVGALNYTYSAPVPTTNVVPKTTNTAHKISLLTHRVKNTEKPLKELMHSDSAILLRNALFDVAESAPLEIPPHLKSQGDPGSYVVQARGPIDNAFLSRLKAAGAQIISYIPNNAYLVRASGAAANQLLTAPETQSILPWEPYFKLDLRLLARAVNEEPLPEGERVSVVVFPGEREAGLKAVEALGAHLIGEDGSPFGHQIIVQPRPDSLAALAQLPIVQSIEPHRGRVLANDLSRVAVRVATNTVPATPNYLGLSGSNVVVNINDTGVEEAHPDLRGRVSGLKFDLVGHGTHIGGTIASSGSNSPPRAPGSTNGATFRGIAHGATLFSQGLDLLSGPVADVTLQQSVARSDVFISNNSWGYPLSDYNQATASYDAAVRDALPGTAGSSPVLFVFAAGNVNNPEYDGNGDESDQIASPATGKNVITVGAVENFRQLTNMFDIGGASNMWFYRETDTDNQVAQYSARGNVGVGLEGEFGRFKPDVVAPGSWVVSCRASQWRDPTNLVSADPIRIVDQFLERRSTNLYFRTIPANATRLLIRVLPNFQSPARMPRLNIHTNLGNLLAVNAGNFAGFNQVLVAPVSPGQFHFAVVNTNSIGVHCDLLTVVEMTNDFGNYFVELKALNDQLRDYYRFESGTSMAAGVVSGTLALMQEFFERRLGRTNSPAMMKALLINGARSLPCNGCDYDFQVRKEVNDQGWGGIQLSNSIPLAVAGGSGTEPSWPIIMIDQEPDNALATGESHTYNIQLDLLPRFEPLMITLVWTDPPGNPVSSTKLVNDLDLVVTNTSVPDGEYYIGNNMPFGNHFTQPSFIEDSNAPPFDVVNNVENVFIEDTLAETYSITVRARRVNVNAVTGQTNGIRQDYALVISSADSALSNTFVSITLPLAKDLGTDRNPYFQVLSNKVARFNERVGANSPQLDVVPSNQPSPSHGTTNQWNFYVFNNTNDTHTNIAFITFLAPELSIPRVRDADIDLYVSRSPTLTNLNDGVVNGARKSLTRGGTEMVILTGADADVGEYYVGVKSEDQQAASYSIFVIAQQKPFGERDENGNILLDFIPVRDFCIPDGSPESPGGAIFLAPILDPLSPNVRRVILTNDIFHQRGGDLLGTIRVLGSAFAGVPPSAVLNNHRQFITFENSIYDDSGEDDIPFSRRSDGPGSLREFEGRPANGLWQFTMVDNSPFHTGCVTRLVGMIEPQDDTNAMGNGIILVVDGGKWRFTTVDVPPGVTNLQVFITHEPNATFTGSGPLDVFIRRDFRPTLTSFDKNGTVQPPGGVVEHGRNDFPSLQSGRYHIGVHNPNSGPIRFRLRIVLQYGLRPLETFTYLSTNQPTQIPDDLRTNFVIGVTNARTVGDVKVGVRIDHPRLSDLVLHLVSPEGTRILLAENRGLMQGTNYGEGVPKDFIVPINSSGSNTETRVTLNTSNRQGIVRIDFSSFEIPDTLRVYYEGNRIFDSGSISITNGLFNIPYGPGISTFVEIVVNEAGNPVGGTRWEMTVQVTGPWNYAVFTDQSSLGDPIKFAFPPFSREPTTILVFSNSFEDAFAGLYATNPSPPAITTVADWTVRSNSVAILSDTNVASTGSNFLALSHGMISRGLTNLLPGREYIFNFAQRKISSSPTQNVRVPVSIYADPYNNLNPVPNPPATIREAAIVPKLRLCPGQDVTVLCTNTINFNGNFFDGRGDTNNLDPNNGFPRYGLIGCWSSHPTVLDQRSRASLPFYIGAGTNSTGGPDPVVIAAPEEPGDYYLFLGVNDADQIVPSGAAFFFVDLRWAQCQLASADYVIGNTPVKLQGRWRTNWATESLLMMGNPTTTNIAFNADHNSTILLDSVMIDELIPSAHYLSEEPLAPLRGETAMGNWTLEVTDNRVGPPISGSSSNFPTLLSWSLNFIFQDGPNPIPLINGIPFNARVFGNQVHYFVVSVPLEVNTNLIQFRSVAQSGGGVELLYSHLGLPEGTVPPDPIPPMLEGAPFGVSSNYPPLAPIIPGRQYFLAIRNRDPLTPFNDYFIQVDFVNVPIIQMQPGTPGNIIPPLPGTFLQTRADSSLAVANMHYYYMDIGANTNVFFRLQTAGPDRPPPGHPDVHLVAKRALPVSDLFPRPTSYEYHSTESVAPDQIIITTNSIPVKLAPGRWYVGVYNVGTNAVNYNLIYHDGLSPFIPVYNLTHLDIGTNDHVVTNFTVSPANRLEDFYHFVTDQTNAAVLFEIFDLTSDVDLIVRRSDLPSRDLYDFSFLSTGPTPRFGNSPADTGYEPIPLRTNVFIPTLGVNANWYIALANRSTSLTATGQLCIKIFTNINPIVGCDFKARFTDVAGVLNLDWNVVPGTRYDVEVTSDLITWTTIAVDVKPPLPIPPNPGGLQFFRIRAY
jgi:subtilisin-like proprotein convertase family protein